MKKNIKKLTARIVCRGFQIASLTYIVAMAIAGLYLLVVATGITTVELSLADSFSQLCLRLMQPKVWLWFPVAVATASFTTWLFTPTKKNK